MPNLSLSRWDVVANREEVDARQLMLELKSIAGVEESYPHTKGSEGKTLPYPLSMYL